MDFKSKRRRSFGVIIFFMFLNGVEYAVVFPTLWEYLLRLGVPESDVYYLGASIASLTVTDMVASLFVGRLLDRFSRVSLFFLLLNLCQIVSSILYLVASSPAWIIVSRLVGGIGNVIGVALTTDVCRATTKEERTPIIVGLNIAQQIGLLFGPACNLFLREIRFTLSLGPLSLLVDKLNAPGLFMGSLYLVLEVAVLAFYHDLARARREEEEAMAPRTGEEEGGGDSQSVLVLEKQDEGAQADVEVASPLLINVDEHLVPQAPLSQPSPSPPPSPPTWSEYLDEILRGEIVALIFLRMIGLLGQTCFETIVTPMMRTFFNYGDFENSILYLAGGVELVVVSVAMAWIAKRVEDRRFVAFGVALHFVTLAFFLAAVPRFKPGDRGNLAVFAVAVVLDLASISIILDISLALITKLVKDEVQGFATGVRRFFSNISFLLGPLWGGGALPWEDVLFAVPLVLLTIGAVLFFHSYPRMKTARDDDADDREVEGEEVHHRRPSSHHSDASHPDETSPLLPSDNSAVST